MDVSVVSRLHRCRWKAVPCSCKKSMAARKTWPGNAVATPSAEIGPPRTELPHVRGGAWRLYLIATRKGVPRPLKSGVIKPQQPGHGERKQQLRHDMSSCVTGARGSSKFANCLRNRWMLSCVGMHP